MLVTATLDLDDIQTKIFEVSGRKIDKGQLSRELTKLKNSKLVRSVSHKDKRKKYFGTTDRGTFIVTQLSSAQGHLSSALIEKTRAESTDVEFFVEKILEEGGNDNVRKEAVNGLVRISQDHYLPLHEKDYRKVLGDFKKVLKDPKLQDIRPKFVQVIHNIAFNSARDDGVIRCLRDSFKARLKEMLKSDPLVAANALDTILLDSERVYVYKELLESWMKDIKGEKEYNSQLDSLFHQISTVFKSNQREVREWLFQLMERQNTRVAQRAILLHRRRIARPAQFDAPRHEGSSSDE